MPRENLSRQFADVFGRTCHLQGFIQGPRRSVRFNVTAFDCPELPEPDGDDAQAADHCDVADDARDLAALVVEHQPSRAELHRLTPKQRQVIEEVIFKGRTITDVSAELGPTVEALRQRVVGTSRPGGRCHGGISRKAPILYALWLFRHRERHDISEVLNAISRAANSLNPQPPDQPS